VAMQPSAAGRAVLGIQQVAAQQKK